MKKKIAIITAILLCVVLICTFVACKKKVEDPETTVTKYTISDSEQEELKVEINAFVEDWLNTHAEEEGKVTDQSKGLKAAIEGQKNVFYFVATVDKTQKSIKMGNVKVTFKATADGGTYDIDITYSDDKVLEKSVVLSFKGKEAQSVKYGKWAGTKLSDSWLIDDGSVPSASVDKIVEAAVNTANNVTGNAVTGKFGADGVVGINIKGVDYGLRIKGNVDVTDKTKNEIGLVLLESVDVNADEIGGIYYLSAAAPEDCKLYIQYPTRGEDGNLVRENGKIVHNYKYINYADIYGILKSAEALPEAKEKTEGALTFKDEQDTPIEVDGLESLLEGFGMKDPSLVTMAINMVTTAYKDDATNTYYIDINLGELLSKANTLLGKIGNIDALNDLEKAGIDVKNLSGLLGHITIAGTIEDVEVGDETVPMLSGFELSLNIPECNFYLNGERKTESNPNANEKVLNVPAISFAISIKDFNFLSDGRIENVVPTEAKTNAVRFSPANLKLSGDVYVNHTEAGKDPYEATFHFDFVTDVNPLEIAVNGFDSTARGALVIKQHSGKVTYDKNAPAGWTNFLSISYEQEYKLLCMSGTALDMDDGGNTVYTAYLDSSFYDVMRQWLGINGDTWNGLGWDATNKKIYPVDYALTSDTKFKADKTYYKLVSGKYVEADDFVVGDAVPADTYYFKMTRYTSAEIIFTDEYVSGLVNDIINYYMKKQESSKENEGGEGGEGGESEIAAAGFDIANISDYFSSFEDLYKKYLEQKKIVISLEEDDFVFGADVSLEMINEVIGVINTTFDQKIETISDPQYVHVFINTEDYKDKCFAEVKFDNNEYILLIDDSVAKNFTVTFTTKLSNGRSYTFEFKATKSDEGDTWSASVKFDIQGKNDETPAKHWEVGLSNYHGVWGEDYSADVEGLLLSGEEGALPAGAQPIFPSTDVEKSVGNTIAQTLVDLLNKEEKVQQIIDAIMDLLL